MPLRLGYETPPYIQILHGPSVGPAEEDVMRHDVVVAEGRDNRDDVVFCRGMLVMVLSEDLGELGDHVLILAYDLPLCSGNFLVVVVPCRVARPDDKVYAVPDIVVDPLERLVDERVGRVAGGRLCAVYARGAMFAVASSVCCGARVCLVVGVRMKVCGRPSVGGRRRRASQAGKRVYL